MSPTRSLIAGTVIRSRAGLAGGRAADEESEEVTVEESLRWLCVGKFVLLDAGHIIEAGMWEDAEMMFHRSERPQEHALEWALMCPWFSLMRAWEVHTDVSVRSMLLLCGILSTVTP